MVLQLAMLAEQIARLEQLANIKLTDRAGEETLPQKVRAIVYKGPEHWDADTRTC